VLKSNSANDDDDGGIGDGWRTTRGEMTNDAGDAGDHQPPSKTTEKNEGKREK
jgi:hypothetical protein